MARKTLAISLAAVLVLSTVAFGASAFTSATVERQASIDVVSDASGPLALQGGATGITTQSDNGELMIDVSQLSGASGINPDASYTFGDASVEDSGTFTASDYVFNVTNTDDVNHSISMTYTPNDGSVSANNVVFKVYKFDGGSTSGTLATVKADGTSASFNAESGTTYHVVVVFDTGIDGADITDSGSLSGTLNVSV